MKANQEIYHLILKKTKKDIYLHNKEKYYSWFNISIIVHNVISKTNKLVKQYAK